MKKLLIILITITLLFGCGSSDEITPNNSNNNDTILTFEKIFYTDDIGLGICLDQTYDGGYIVTGGLGDWGSHNGDLYFFKTDSNGIEQWIQRFDNMNYKSGQSIQQTYDGGYIITGKKTDGNGDNIYLLKTDENGIEQWSNNFSVGHGISKSVKQTNDGGYIITGYRPSQFSMSYNIFLIKTDINGLEEWSKDFGGTNNDWGFDVTQTNDGGYIVTGGTVTIFEGTSNVFLFKTDVNGIEEWSKEFGSLYEDYGNSVQQTTDGGYIISGNKEPSYNQQDVYIIKTDSNGNEEWNRTFGGPLSENGNSVQQTVDGGYIISYHGLIKTDLYGMEQWRIEDYDKNLMSVQQTIDGGYISCGNVGTSTGPNILVIKTDQSGNIN